MTIDYTEIDKQQALKNARDMIAQRGGVDCGIVFDEELGFVRFDFDGSDEYSWVYPDGTRDVQHPDTEDGGLFEDMTNTSGMYLEIYRCHRFDDPMYGLFNADFMFDDDFAEMVNPDDLRTYGRSLVEVADRLDEMNMDAMEHWRKA